jgi:hypothetical protein
MIARVVMIGERAMIVRRALIAEVTLAMEVVSSRAVAMVDGRSRRIGIISSSRGV